MTKFPRCGFCHDAAAIWNARHTGRMCKGCGVLYVEHEGEWFLDRTASRGKGWKQFPDGCMVVLGRRSWEEGG